MADVDALVLWLDMLGYKNWLASQTDLGQAERALEEALSIAFSQVSGRYPGNGKQFGIESLLISDTIILWSHKLDSFTFTTLTVLYHVLHCEMAEFGMSLRGALAIGSLRVRPQPPHILLGSAIVLCATLEPRLDAFVVGVDHSVMQFIRALPESEQPPYTIHLMTCAALKGDPPREVVVLKWGFAAMGHVLVRQFRSLLQRADESKSAVNSLRAFLPKFRHSEQMLDAVLIHDEFLEAVRADWIAAQSEASHVLAKLATDSSRSS